MSTEKAMEGCKGQIIVVPRTGELFHHKRKSNLSSLLSCDVSIKTGIILCVVNVPTKEV